MTKIAPQHWILSSDHRGFELRQYLANWLKDRGHKVDDIGPATPERADAPLLIDDMVDKLKAEPNAFGLFICGTAGTPAIRANRYPGIRAVSPCTAYQAELAKSHGQSHIICLGANVVPPVTAIEILSRFMQTEFIKLDPAYQRRLKQLDAPIK